ncbi:winged helix-turn-helix transcriptional regulator [Frondihabitans cladoniiphilus]|uniref:Helix-turn-helix domain-containing protein n=1 Tax=Frondihabitans cladoniiphilus TaxID=715785 RepID=A0ABP8W9T0_9MICO
MSPRSSLDPSCGIARSLDVVGERWALLIVRDALVGSTRFSEFRSSLGVSPDILTARLATLVEHGVFERRSYQAPGEREREEYLLTPAGHDLLPVVATLGAWGFEHRPLEHPRRYAYVDETSGEHLRVAFVDSSGRVVETPDVAMVRVATPA